MDSTDFVKDIAYALRDLGANVVEGGDYLFFPDTPRQLRIFFCGESLNFFVTRIEEGRTERQYAKTRPGRLPFHVRTLTMLSRSIMFLYEQEIYGRTKASLLRMWRYGLEGEGEDGLAQLLAANAEKIDQEEMDLARISRELAEQQRKSPALAWGTCSKNNLLRDKEMPSSMKPGITRRRLPPPD